MDVQFRQRRGAGLPLLREPKTLASAAVCRYRWLMGRVANTLVNNAPDHPVRQAERSPAQAIRKYGLALLLVAAGFGGSHPLRAELYTTPLFFAAVVISAWYGGAGPGMFAVLASAASIHYFIHVPRSGL